MVSTLPTTEFRPWTFCSTRAEHLQRGSRRLRSSPRSVIKCSAVDNRCLVVSNDDGVASPLTLELAGALRDEFGLRTVLVAPVTNKSASSMALTLRQDMRLSPCPDLGPDTYALQGTPSDCIAVTLDPGKGVLSALGLEPVLCIVGPNYGANVSADVLCSGTVSAARMAAMMGVPAMATSSTLMDRSESHLGVIEATLETAQAALHTLQGQPAANWPRSYFPLPQRGRRHWSHSSCYAEVHEWEEDEGAREMLLAEAFQNGDVFLNVNVSRRWDPQRPKFFSTCLGLMFYRDPFHVHYQMDALAQSEDRILLHPNRQRTADVFGRAFPLRGQATDEITPPSRVPTVFHNKFNTRLSEDVEGGDLWALQQGGCSITTLQTWPEGHPLCMKDIVMSAALRQAPNGMPAWLNPTYAVPVVSKLGLVTTPTLSRQGKQPNEQDEPVWSPI